MSIYLYTRLATPDTQARLGVFPSSRPAGTGFKRHAVDTNPRACSIRSFTRDGMAPKLVHVNVQATRFRCFGEKLEAPSLLWQPLAKANKTDEAGWALGKVCRSDPSNGAGSKHGNAPTIYTSKF
ncbi:unnamed protein product [Clonostachys rosea]|uniref:Uncharacterized protein n=1 Tax=Bionectria ochroleuca TaxID=29856 RepID=A0ABY6TW22_BIOOC|nr:unnamed protein product [Clonostachys rosea]